MLQGGLRDLYTRAIDKELVILRELARDLNRLTEPNFIRQTLHKQDADVLLPRGSLDNLANLGRIACVTEQDEPTDLRNAPFTYVVPHPTSYCKWLERQRKHVAKSRLEILRGATLDIRRRKDQRESNVFKDVLDDWQNYNAALKRWTHEAAPKQYAAYLRRKEKYNYLNKIA